MGNFGLAAGNSLLLVCVLIECMAVRFVMKEKMPLKEIIVNLNSGHILMWILRGVEVSVFWYVSTHFSLGFADSWPYWLKIVVGFVGWDFSFYWLHRMHHRFGALWAVHVVHHEAEHFNLSVGIRNSWYSSVTSIPFFLWLALIGIPVEIFVLVSSIQYFIQFYNHNHIVKKSGFLEYIMITPSHHRVHHGRNEKYIDRNFGGTFVFWDKLFGTFQPELEEEPVEFGTHDPVYSENPVIFNNVPWLKLFRIPFVGRWNKRGELNVNEIVLFFAAVYLFVELLFYVYFQDILPRDQKIALFSMIFVGTIANGVLSEGRMWGLLLWLITFGIAPVVFGFLFPVAPMELRVMLYAGIVFGMLPLFRLQKGRVEVKEVSQHN